MDEPITLGPGAGEQVGDSTVKVARPELSLLEGVVDPGDEVKPHLHRAQSDSFYVLEGELEFLIDGRVVTATAGSYVLSPPGVVHGFRNVSEKPARVLNIHTPGGFVEYRRELADLREQGIEPDGDFFERHDIFGF